MSSASPQVFIGTSGWSYKHWKENFYPEKLKPIEWLSYYGSVFSTVEINSTFYHFPRTSTVENWNAQVPADFTFSVKANRYITHRKRLHDCQETLEFFYKNIESFRSKLGPILFQLPPSFKINGERLTEFIGLLDKNYLYTFEFRHPTWFNSEIYNLLRKHNIALCITDLDGSLSPDEITSHFTYIRLHGPKKAYQGTYGPLKLRGWKRKIERWLISKTSVYCYFDNDEKGYAVEDAKYLLDAFNKPKH